jgi:single-strand binding protein/primosomal replication protein n
MSEDIVTNKLTNNDVRVVGVVVSKPMLHHSTHGEDFYEFKIEVPRLNKGVHDTIKIEVSDRVFDVSRLEVDSIVSVVGQFRSFNEYNSEMDRMTLRLFVFVKDIEILEEDDAFDNEITLRGFICKEVVHRKTPSGREISDVILSVNRLYNKSDYIPCVVWGRNSKYVANMVVGDEIEIQGRIQSRKYNKSLDDGSIIEREVYEVSVINVSKVEG